MLVLTRYVGDSIRVGNDYRVTVVQLRGDAVTLRFAERLRGPIGRAVSEDATLRRDGVHPLEPDVTVTIVDVRGDKVRLGITSPPHVSVHRQELYKLLRPTDAWPDDDVDEDRR